MAEYPNIVVFATEAGSAENLTAVIKANRNRARFNVFGTGAGFAVLSAEGVNPALVSGPVSNEEVRRLLTDYRADAVLIGRCIDPDSYERVLVGEAKQIGIPCVSLIDEWYDYQRNYLRVDGTVDYPTAICCPNAQAYDEAVSEGIPARLLRVTGSPALAAFTKLIERLDFSGALESDTNPGKSECGVRRVLLLSERIDQGFPNCNDQSHGKNHGPGYDEFEVRLDLHEVLESLGSATYVVEKIHPSMAIDELSDLNTNKIGWQVTNKMSLLSCLSECDIVIGMRSVALLKSYLTGLPTLSYQPSLVGENRCTAVRMGLIKCAITKQQLAGWISEQNKLEPIVRKSAQELHGKDAAAKVFSTITTSISKNIRAPVNGKRF